MLRCRNLFEVYTDIWFVYNIAFIFAMARLELDDTPTSIARRDVTAFFSPQDCVNFLRFTQSQVMLMLDLLLIPAFIRTEGRPKQAKKTLRNLRSQVLPANMEAFYLRSQVGSRAEKITSAPFLRSQTAPQRRRLRRSDQRDHDTTSTAAIKAAVMAFLVLVGVATAGAQAAELYVPQQRAPVYNPRRLVWEDHVEDLEKRGPNCLAEG
ncbi:unnamed protein product [Ectocarpus sp. CCAP 1310/34]|nr:unnamed protein product [Ectocarpus sp. CCAP 1310/34]